MSKRNLGLIFIMIGLTFLMISFVTSTVLWGASLGVSIVLNLIGTAFIMDFLKTNKTKESV